MQDTITIVQDSQDSFLLNVLMNDTDFLNRQNLMDYTLLVGEVLPMSDRTKV